MKNLGSLVSTKRRKMLLASIVLLAILAPAAYATSTLIYYSNIVHLHGGGPQQYGIVLGVTDPNGTVVLTATVTPIPLNPPGAPVKFYVSTDGQPKSNASKAWTLLTLVSQWTDNLGATSYPFNLTGLQVYDFKATVNGTITINGVTTASNVVYTSNFVRASFAGYSIHLDIAASDDLLLLNFTATVTSTDTPARSVNGLTVTFTVSIDNDTTFAPLPITSTATTNLSGIATLNDYAMSNLPVLPIDVPFYGFQAQVPSSIIIEPTPA